MNQPDRIKDEVGKMRRPIVIAVDLDGVIHRYSKGWHDGTIYDDPMPGAKEGLDKLIRAGCEIVIWTTRAHNRVVNSIQQPNQLQELKEWLHKHQIPYHRIHTACEKPLCHVFLDDRAVRHVDWDISVSIIGAICDLDYATKV